MNNQRVKLVKINQKYKYNNIKGWFIHQRPNETFKTKQFSQILSQKQIRQKYNKHKKNGRYGNPSRNKKNRIQTIQIIMVL